MLVANLSANMNTALARSMAHRRKSCKRHTGVDVSPTCVPRTVNGCQSCRRDKPSPVLHRACHDERTFSTMTSPSRYVTPMESRGSPSSASTSWDGTPGTNGTAPTTNRFSTNQERLQVTPSSPGQTARCDRPCPRCNDDIVTGSSSRNYSAGGAGLPWPVAGLPALPPQFGGKQKANTASRRAPYLCPSPPPRRCCSHGLHGKTR